MFCWRVQYSVVSTKAAGASKIFATAGTDQKCQLATSLGATWTSCSPDFGAQAVADGKEEPALYHASVLDAAWRVGCDDQGNLQTQIEDPGSYPGVLIS